VLIAVPGVKRRGRGNLWRSEVRQRQQFEVTNRREQLPLAIN
jgi:hypothetical protein